MNERKEILNILEKQTGDKNLYILIFNILTNDNSLINYTANKNGIWFNLNSIEDSIINLLKNKIDFYLDTKLTNSIVEDSRMADIMEMKKTINNSYKKELKEYIISNKKLSSTIEPISTLTKKVNNSKKIKNSFPKKEPVLKGVYARLSKIIKNHKKKNTLFSEEYDGTEENIRSKYFQLEVDSDNECEVSEIEEIKSVNEEIESVNEEIESVNEEIAEEEIEEEENKDETDSLFGADSDLD